MVYITFYRYSIHDVHYQRNNFPGISGVHVDCASDTGLGMLFVRATSTVYVVGGKKMVFVWAENATKITFESWPGIPINRLKRFVIGQSNLWVNRPFGFWSNRSKFVFVKECYLLIIIIGQKHLVRRCFYKIKIHL